jgi:hypothetical protein
VKCLNVSEELGPPEFVIQVGSAHKANKRLRREFEKRTQLDQFLGKNGYRKLVSVRIRCGE